MEDVVFFLKKFSDLVDKKQSINKGISDIIEELSNLKIETKFISSKNGIIFLKINPSKKSNIFTKKIKIMEKIKEELGISLLDIR